VAREAVEVGKLGILLIGTVVDIVVVRARTETVAARRLEHDTRFDVVVGLQDRDIAESIVGDVN